jgi:hypothetical protein
MRVSPYVPLILTTFIALASFIAMASAAPAKECLPSASAVWAAPGIVPIYPRGPGPLFAPGRRRAGGQWLPWLESEFGWTDKTAENFGVKAAF